MVKVGMTRRMVESFWEVMDVVVWSGSFVAAAAAAAVASAGLDDVVVAMVSKVDTARNFRRSLV